MFSIGFYLFEYLLVLDSFASTLARESLEPTFTLESLEPILTLESFDPILALESPLTWSLEPLKLSAVLD